MSDEIEIIPPSVRHQVPRVVEAVTTVPWAITDEALATILAIAGRDNETTPEALEAYRARSVSGADMLTSRNGVGIISVTGAMFRYASFFTAFSGGATYDAIAMDLTKAVNDPSLRAIVIAWDSPGGEVSGVAELASMIRAYASVKPIESYVGGQCCSAAFWLACATGRITIDRTALLGSIGVKMGIRDSSERDAKSGVKNVEFISSRAPNKRTDWNSDSGKAQIQRMVDQLEAVFIADVAANRGVTEDEVVSKFGAGGVEVGASAVAAGMADALGSFEGVIERLQAGNGKTTSATGRKVPMAQEAAVVFTHTQAQVDTARAEGRSEGLAQGATDAQTRIGAILGSAEGQANRPLAEHFAFKTAMATADVIAALAVQGAAPAATPAKPDPAAPTVVKVEGQRAQDAVGGLALSQATEKSGTEQQPAPKAAAINASTIYGNRAKATAH